MYEDVSLDDIRTSDGLLFGANVKEIYEVENYDGDDYCGWERGDLIGVEIVGDDFGFTNDNGDLIDDNYEHARIFIADYYGISDHMVS
jgi:hypothetical protein